MTTFVDTNVVLDALDPKAPRHKWASESLAAAAIGTLSLERYSFTDGALFKAGKAFAEYKRRGGTKSNVLSDFLIGAQADDEGAPLLTANARDFRSYFPNVTLICPP